MTQRTQNGAKVISRSECFDFHIPGSHVVIPLANSNTGLLLADYLCYINRWVEPLDVGRDDFGWAPVRDVRGGDDISNHCAGEAADNNSLQHPLGKIGTYHKLVRYHGKMVYKSWLLHRRLRVYEGVLRSGMDYSRRKDDMHTERVGSYADVDRVVHKRRNSSSMRAVLKANPKFKIK